MIKSPKANLLQKTTSEDQVFFAVLVIKFRVVLDIRESHSSLDFLCPFKSTGIHWTKRMRHVHLGWGGIYFVLRQQTCGATFSISLQDYSTHLGTRRVRYGRGKWHWPATRNKGRKQTNKPPAALPVRFFEASLSLFSAWHQSCTFFPVISAFTTSLPTMRMSGPLMVTSGLGFPSPMHITNFGGIYLKDTTSAPSVKRISKIKRGTSLRMGSSHIAVNERRARWREERTKLNHMLACYTKQPQLHRDCK